MNAATQYYGFDTMPSRADLLTVFRDQFTNYQQVFHEENEQGSVERVLALSVIAHRFHELAAAEA